MIARSASVSGSSMSVANQAGVPERRRVTRWTKGGFVGVVAGALFMAVEMFLVLAFGNGSIWDPVRLSASIAIGSRTVTASSPFTFDIFFIGMLVHFVLSIFYAVVLGMIIRRLPVGLAIVIGGFYGLVLYAFHFYGLATFYPWVAGWRSWITIVTHLVFGISAAWVYSHLHMRQLMREAGLVSNSSS